MTEEALETEEPADATDEELVVSPMILCKILLLFFQMLLHGILDISLVIQAVEAVEILHMEHSWELNEFNTHPCS